MKPKEYTISGKNVRCYFNGSIAQLDQYADPSRTILIMDDQVSRFHGDKLKGWKTVVVQGNETSKDIRVVERVVNELIGYEADRKTMLIGIGGGVVTDLTGFVGSIYMRGLSYAFVPTTLLAQVDAAVGGKNGINYGSYKNMLGIIRQPDFLLFDDRLLQTLPETEWYNGFAEIIKYACISDSALFDFLEEHMDEALSHDSAVIARLVERSVEIKLQIVQEDELENGQRRLLNFGHTVGHAVEKLEGIAHGQAVAKGMAMATLFSEEISGLPEDERQRILRLTEAYHLPLAIRCDADAISRYFRMDKKREQQAIHFILLEKIGRAVVRPLPLEQLAGLLRRTLQTEKIR